MRLVVVIAALSLTPALALAESATGGIAGAADPGVQIIVTGLGDNHTVVGKIGERSGTYRVSDLPPGRYMLKEQGPHHVAREVEVRAGQMAQVDLRPPK